MALLQFIHITNNSIITTLIIEKTALLHCTNLFDIEGNLFFKLKTQQKETEKKNIFYHKAKIL